MPTSSFKLACLAPLLALAACMGGQAGLSPAYAPSYAPPPPPVPGFADDSRPHVPE